MLQTALARYIDTHLVDVADKVEVCETDCHSSRNRIVCLSSCLIDVGTPVVMRIRQLFSRSLPAKLELRAVLFSSPILHSSNRAGRARSSCLWQSSN